MKATVWIVAKPGEPRVFSQMTEPSPERVDALHAAGYRIIVVDFDLPPEFDPSDAQAKGRVRRAVR